MSSAFVSRCDLPAIESISALELVPDCTVPAAPEPLRDQGFGPAPATAVRPGPPGPTGPGGGPVGPRGPEGAVGADGPAGLGGVDPRFLPSQVDVTNCAGAAQASGAIAQAGNQFQLTTAWCLPRGTGVGGAEELGLCNLYVWCPPGDWELLIFTNPFVEPPPIEGDYFHQAKIRCPCEPTASSSSSSSSSGPFDGCCGGADPPSTLLLTLYNLDGCACVEGDSWLLTRQGTSFLWVAATGDLCDLPTLSVSAGYDTESCTWGFGIISTCLEITPLDELTPSQCDPYSASGVGVVDQLCSPPDCPTGSTVLVVLTEP